MIEFDENCNPQKKKLKSYRPLEEQEQLDNGFLMIEKDKWRIKLNKPSHAGASMC